MANVDKKKYNQAHYQKNKEAILNRAKARYKAKNQGSESPKVVSLFGSNAKTPALPPPPEPPKRSKGRTFQLPHFSWTAILLGILVATITVFLFNETAKFFAEFDGQGGSAYLKAFILEGSAVAFSLLKGKSGVQRLGYRTMTILIYAYSIWVVSGGVIQKALSLQSAFHTNRQAISELENEIRQISSVRDSYFSAKRFTAGLSVEENLKIFQQKLEKAREESKNLPNSSALWNTLLVLVAFRILAMASNLMLLQELGGLFRMRGKFS